MWRFGKITPGTGPPTESTGEHEGHDVAELKKGSRVTGGDRDKLAEELKKRYEGGESIRLLAESSGRSYGFVHRILNESGATLRGRGGATRRKATAEG